MNVTLLTVGSLKERYWREAVAEYEKRLSAYCKFRLIEVKDEKTPDAIDSAASRRVRQKEGERLLEKIDARSLVVTL
ncbi:23S rRNA (pseudouridine(1915)-N(3))-methyltransferase RlmH, partial [Stomatobaculum longum]